MDIKGGGEAIVELDVSPEVLEGSSDEDEVEDETFGRIFPRSRRRRGEEFFPFTRPFQGQDEEFLGILAFFSAILRKRLLILVFQGRGQDEARNFASFLGYCKCYISYLCIV